MDFDLLKIVANKESFTRFKPYIKEHTLSKEGQKLFSSVEEFYKQFPGVKQLDWTAFETWFLGIKKAQLSSDSIPTYRTAIQKLRTDPPTMASDALLQHYIAHDYAAQIANEAVKGGDADLDKISDLVKQHDKEVGRALNLSDLFVTDDVEVALSTDPGLEWRLEELNISCGPLRQGDFVVVGARPETGKTTFLADQVSHMATQITSNRPVVWVNNEERSNKVKRRIMQAALGITLKDFQADPVKARDDYQKLMGGPDRILVTGSSAGLNNIKHLIPKFRELNPALIVFDQLDKVAGFEGRAKGGDREDLRLGSLYQWARELAHEYGPVIAASQASDSAEGEQWVYQHQLRGSRTDKAGEADAIITIGKKHDATMANKRFIHVPKNKLDGGPRSVEKERHGFWEVEIRPEIARYEGTR